MPLRDTEGGAVLVRRDVTDRKKSEVELARLRMDVWHAHRVAQTGAIAASLAHELNQPLAAILSNAQAGGRLLAGPDPDLDEIRDILADIVQDDKRAAGVIVGLRAMLRRKETQRERLDLEEAVRQVLDLLHGELIARDIQIEVQAAPGCSASVDRAQIQQVILNVVMNAFEAMESGPPGPAPARDLPDARRSRSCRGRLPRFGSRHHRGRAAARVRCVLHHQAARDGHRPGDLPQHRREPRREPLVPEQHGQGVTFFISLPRPVARRPAAETGDQPGA